VKVATSTSTWRLASPEALADSTRVAVARPEAIAWSPCYCEA